MTDFDGGPFKERRLTANQTIRRKLSQIPVSLLTFHNVLLDFGGGEVFFCHPMFANATFDGLLVNLMMRVRLVRMKVLGRVLVGPGQESEVSLVTICS